MLILVVILLALCGYGAWEYLEHQRRLKRIPIRIHVNGSRGKSSVTRLIAAGLRAGGIRTVGKTTGTLPRIIDPEGREIAIIRDQRANIIEQVKILRFIGHYNPQALVIECMAVLPEYQWICEHQMIRSTVGVITNSRLDHTNEMGKFREQIAQSLANTCPVKGVLFTSEKSNLHVLKEVAERNQTLLRRVGGAQINNGELRRFGHIEHPANVGLALAVCEWAGVDRDTALQGMYTSVPDAGALRVALCKEDHKELLFVNALAANDPESSLEIWHQIRERFSPLGTVIILLNSRADRQDRSVQLIEMISENISFDLLVLTGEKTQRFMSYAMSNKIPREKIVPVGWQWHEKVYTKLFELIKDKGTILGIGNVGAGGLDLFRYFYKQRSFPVDVECPECHESLMDASVQIDDNPAVKIEMKHGSNSGPLWLSCIWGSYKPQFDINIPEGEIVQIYCPHCNVELVAREICPKCGIPMVPLQRRGRGMVYFCPRRGCKGHQLVVPEN
jgi:poly-gamma-glutamate synthase PgsB/CapB